MTVDIAVYNSNKKFVQTWFLSKGRKDIKYTIPMMASTTGVPCIVVAFWLGEITNWHQDSIDAIDRFKKFYGYTNIKNIPPGAPV